MAACIRFARYGMKKQPHFRVVVADERRPRDGKFIEVLGTYDPRKKTEKVNIDKDRLGYWLKNGARPSKTLSDILARSVKEILLDKAPDERVPRRT